MKRADRSQRRGGAPADSKRAPTGRLRRIGVAALLTAMAIVAVGLHRSGRLPTLGRGSPPNVLLITIDTLRWDHVGSYGSRTAKTPVLDGLAARGVRFESAVMHAPLTAPSHASILTGLAPPSHGVRDNGAFALPRGVPTLATLFKAAGYATAAFVSGFPLDRRFGFSTGFDLYDDRLPRTARPGLPGLPGAERRGDATSGRALAWLAQHASNADPGDRARPWFLWVHYFDPHTPYAPPLAWADRYPGNPYAGEIAFVDDQIGRLLQAIEKMARIANTLVLVTADHGESLGEHGEETHGVFVYDATLRVPLILAGPGVPKGRSSTVVARGVDILPTLAELAHVTTGGAHEGRSLVGALSRDRLGDEPTYIESLLSARHFGLAELHGLRTSRWKYISAPVEELYDLVHDGAEKTNIAAAQPQLASAMSRRLEAARRARADLAAAVPTEDADARRRLRSLGYVTGPSRQNPAGTRRDPKSSIGLINRVEHAIAATHVDPRRAVEQLRGVLAEDQGISIARSQLAATLASIGEHQAALDQIDILKTSGAAGPEDFLIAAESLRALGRARGAKIARDEAARLDPASPEPALTEARAEMAAERPSEAAAAFRRALEIAPDQPEALAGLADIALSNGDISAASAYIERLLAQDPDDLAARTRLGMIRGRQGRLAEAIETLRQVVEEAPDNAQALAGLAAALARSGAPAAAVPYFERAVAAGPATPAVLNGLGFARLESGDYKGALAALCASLEMNANQPAVAAAARDLDKQIARAPRGRR